MTIFIGGYSRTGTTLMQGLVCADPRAIPVTEEASYFHALVAAYARGLQLWDVHTRDFFDGPGEFAAFHRGVLQSFLDHLHRRHGADRRVVLKEPALTPFFPLLDELLEGSVFIVMVRDPRDAIASKRSKMRAQYANPRHGDVRVLLGEYVSWYRSVLAARERFGPRLLLVRYEELVARPEPVLVALRGLTGLALMQDPRVAGFGIKRGDVHSRSALDGRPVSTEAIGRHRGTLSADDCRHIEQHRPSLTMLFGFDPFADPAAEGAST